MASLHGTFVAADRKFREYMDRLDPQNLDEECDVSIEDVYRHIEELREALIALNTKINLVKVFDEVSHF